MAAQITGNAAIVIGTLDAFFDMPPNNSVYVGQVAYIETHGESVYAAEVAKVFETVGHSTLATQVLTNIGITGNTVPPASVALLNEALTEIFAVYAGARGQVVLNLTRLLSGLEGDATFGAAATAFNNGMVAAFEHSQQPDRIIPSMEHAQVQHDPQSDTGTLVMLMLPQDSDLTS